MKLQDLIAKVLVRRKRHDLKGYLVSDNEFLDANPNYIDSAQQLAREAQRELRRTERLLDEVDDVLGRVGCQSPMCNHHMPPRAMRTCFVCQLRWGLAMRRLARARKEPSR